MINEARIVAADGCVNGHLTVTNLKQKRVMTLHFGIVITAVCFVFGNQLTGVFNNAGAFANRLRGKCALALNIRAAYNKIRRGGFRHQWGEKKEKGNVKKVVILDEVKDLSELPFSIYGEGVGDGVCPPESD